MTFRIINADVMDGLRQLEDESVHCVCTSPPYWGLRDYGVAGQIGLEPTPDAFVARMVEVFREVRRVLRKDGTAWVNLGDSYSGAGRDGGTASLNGAATRQAVMFTPHAKAPLKPKDLMGMPWRVAFALQADGWWLRSDIIWAKPNPMPESVTDRPTKAHEYVFLLTKAASYYYDSEAIKETSVYGPGEGGHQRFGAPNGKAQIAYGRQVSGQIWNSEGTRNKRSVWTIATHPYAEAHFATFPPELPEICIKAGTSQHGCCGNCGAPWGRETETSYDNPGNRTTNGARSLERRHETAGFPVRLEKRTATLGWSPSCSCNADVVPATVLDPFSGAGTTCLVADRLQRNAIGIELNPTYAAMAERRLAKDRGGLLDLMEAPPASTPLPLEAAE